MEGLKRKILGGGASSQFMCVSQPSEFGQKKSHEQRIYHPSVHRLDIFFLFFLFFLNNLLFLIFSQTRHVALYIFRSITCVVYSVVECLAVSM